MTGEREASEPLSPFSDEGAAPQNAIQSGVRITIADILFCMFAVSLSLMSNYQPRGVFEENQSSFGISGVIIALGASIFFTANRLRRARGESFSTMPPGFFIALHCAGALACDAFQYFASHLNTRHVGAPIHVLAAMSPYLVSAALSTLTILRAKLSSHWLAVFASNFASALLLGACTAAYYFASRSDLNDSLSVAGVYLWRLGFAAWSLAALLLFLAYLVDLFARIKREWWHHAAVILQLLRYVIAFYESPDLVRFLKRLYYSYLNYW